MFQSDSSDLFPGVKGPKKIFPDMPFGNMDSDKIEARKGLLETFLKVGGKPFCSALVLFVSLLLHFWWLLSVSTFSATVRHP